MAETKYEKYVIRKPAIIAGRDSEGRVKFKVPDTVRIPPDNEMTTGPRLIFSNDVVREATVKIEYGFVMRDTTLLYTSPNYGAHKHDYAEIFLFLGTNPCDTNYLGAEGEFWLGEGDDLEKIRFDTSCSIYVPAGVAHFPLFFRNVKSPVMMGVVLPIAGEFKLVPVSRS